MPDENSDGYTTTMPRFFAKETLLYHTGDAATTLIAPIIYGTGAVFSRASAVGAAAAVAIGTATLAFSALENVLLPF